jgi:hypothetical protein
MCVCRRPGKQIVPQHRVLRYEDCRAQAVLYSSLRTTAEFVHTVE